MTTTLARCRFVPADFQENQAQRDLNGATPPDEILAWLPPGISSEEAKEVEQRLARKYPVIPSDVSPQEAARLARNYPAREIIGFGIGGSRGIRIIVPSLTLSFSGGGWNRRVNAVVKDVCRPSVVVLLPSDITKPEAKMILNRLKEDHQQREIFSFTKDGRAGLMVVASHGVSLSSHAWDREVKRVIREVAPHVIS